MKRIQLLTIMGLLCYTAQAHAQVVFGAEVEAWRSANGGDYGRDTTDGGEGVALDGLHYSDAPWNNDAVASTQFGTLRLRCAWEGSIALDTFGIVWDTYTVTNLANPTGTFTLQIQVPYHAEVHGGSQYASASFQTSWRDGGGWHNIDEASAATFGQHQTLSGTLTHTIANYQSGTPVVFRVEAHVRASGPDTYANAYNTAAIEFSSPDPGVELVVTSEGGYAPPPDCPGDVDGDGDSDVSDFGLFAPALGSNSGTPGWDPACDLNSDDVVDLLDFAIFAPDFGCPN